MGYFGTLSKACSHCRSRRLKCDLATPSCGQCERGSRVCFGYRNPTDVLFLDQSKAVARNAQRSKQKSQRGTSQPMTNVSSNSCDPFHAISQLDFSKTDAPLPTPVSLSLSAENLGLCYFLSNYPSQSANNCKSFFEYIPELYHSELPDNALPYIVTAIGLAGLSFHTETSGMEVAAGAWYNKALNKVNNSLRDRKLVKGDHTLLAVLLFGLYETNTCQTPKSMKSWLNHIRGATALLDLRGEEQLDSELGRTLFKQTRTQIISACYQTRSPIPDMIVQLSRKCHEIAADILEDLSQIIFQFCNIRAEAPFRPPTTQLESITRANILCYASIAQELEEWHNGISADFHPSTLFAPQSSLKVLSEYYEVYEDIWTAAILNNYCVNSILVHEALILQLAFLRDNYTYDESTLIELQEQILHSGSTILSLIEKVCASVPSLLQTNFAAAGVGLLWGLYVSAQISPDVAPLPDDTRSWIIGCMEQIGSEMGVCQATTLVRALHQQVGVPELLKN